MFQGSMVALVTPMKANGEIDLASLRNLVDLHLEKGTDAIVVIGTTGESPTLEAHEHDLIIREVVKWVTGKVPVIAGTGSNSTHRAIQLTQNALESGVDACLLITPYYNKPTQEGLYQHYRAIAQTVAIPQILYNSPGRTGCDLLPETVARLAEHANIIGVKEGSPQRAKAILELCDGKLDVYSADDITGIQVIQQGGKGIISVTANVAPREMHEMCKLALAGNYQQANMIDERLVPLHKNLFLESNPIPVKWALHEMGLIPPGIRLPLTPLAESHQQVLKQALQQAGLL